MARIFSVPFNLDEFAAEMDSMVCDKEIADWLKGFKVGSRGIVQREGWPAAMVAGWQFGNTSHIRATDFQKKKSEAGKHSAEVRKVKHGSAQPSNTPRTLPEHCSNCVQAPIEESSNYRESSIEYLISKNENPISGEPERVAVAPRKRAQPVKTRETVFVGSHKRLVKGTNSDRIEAIRLCLDKWGIEIMEKIITTVRTPTWANEFPAMIDAMLEGPATKATNPHPPETPAWYDWHAMNIGN